MLCYFFFLVGMQHKVLEWCIVVQLNRLENRKRRGEQQNHLNRIPPLCQHREESWVNKKKINLFFSVCCFFSSSCIILKKLFVFVFNCFLDKTWHLKVSLWKWWQIFHSHFIKARYLIFLKRVKTESTRRDILQEKQKDAVIESYLRQK